MSSNQHQSICSFIILRMAHDGYTTINAFDGEMRDGYFKEYPTPQPIGRHRPDCIASNKDGIKAIGEAKTTEDLRSTRTIEEVLDFTETCKLDPNYNYLYFGYPFEGELLFEEMIEKIPVHNRKYLIPLRYNTDLDDEENEF